MPGNGTSCTLPDGTTVDLTNATPEEAQACLTNPGTTLRLEEVEAPQPQPHAGKKKDMEPTPTESAPTEAAALPAAEPAADATPVLSAHEEQPASEPASAEAASQINELMKSSGGGATGIIAALIAVVGGTAGFRLWTKVTEQKHEQQMKKLDIDQANAGLGGAQPPPCQAAHQTLVADIKALQTEVAALKMRFEKVEKKASGFDPGVDVGDLEDRVEALEKSLRKKARGAEGTH